MHKLSSILILLLLINCDKQDQSKLIYVETPAAFYEPYFDFARLSPDGKTGIISGFRGARLVDLSLGKPDPERMRGPFASTFDARFLPDGGLLRLAVDRGTTGWWLESPQGPELTEIPPGVDPELGPRPGLVAFVAASQSESSPPGITFLQETGEAPITQSLPGELNALSWFPDGERVAAILLGDDHKWSLWEVPINKQPRSIAHDIDVQYILPKLAVSSDGTRIFVPLASAHPPDPKDRHIPYADRDLDIYSISVSTGTINKIVDSPDDDFGPNIVGDTLYWMRNTTREQVAVVSIDGGNFIEVFDEAIIPAWHPDGDRIGITYGQWRLVDWVLNLDGASMPWPSLGRNDVMLLIEGYHEDFGPVWSPDGQWIAYHSHRSADPVGLYSAEGTTDDIYLKAADGSGNEIRLTDFGYEAGFPDWSPDGNAVVFVSMDRTQHGLPSRAFVVEIDPAIGEPKTSYRLSLPDSLYVRCVSWGPNSDEFAVEARLPDGSEGIFVLNQSQGSLVRIATYEMTTYGGLDWTPDGTNIVYSALSEGRLELRVITKSGEPIRTIRDPEADLMHPQVSPDGKQIAMSRMWHRKELWRMKLP